ncbi:TonB-dependent receptor domain-containing protein [Thalassotalea hakodatensis]|uniref:TonB-dependent receptor domain-containing protein n=1 Tax=Thalassotalea hakodatensis TaxID=3030492 RepID=UPI0025725178|nr:TonB-dependent receptor [Thalassotalea hakodatensis]
MNLSKNKVTKTVQYALALTGISTMVLGQQVIAAEEDNERITVTGSRIKHSSAQTTTPTTVIDAEAIAQSGVKNIADLMNKLPALLNGVGGSAINNNNGGNINNAGLELANLRGLGTNRTLVLVDGRRHVAGSAGSSAVDLSMIPTSMVERVEVITGGASAIYGADAVTGVVNFIMRKNIEGFEIDASMGETRFNDGESKDLSLQYGLTYAGGKGSLTMHASYSKEEEISIRARDYANKNHTFDSNPANGSNDDGVPDLIFFDDQRFQALSAEGLFYVPNQNYSFGDLPITMVSTVIGAPVFADDPFGFNYDTYTIDREDGHFRDFQAGTNCRVVPCEGGDGFRTEETGTLNVPSERTLFSLATHYDINNNHRLYAEIKYGKTESAASDQASVFHDDNFGPLITITNENPFRPQPLVDIMDQRGLQSVGLAVIGLNARSDTTRETTQFVIGGDGFLGDYHYTYYAQHGKVSTELLNDDVLNENYYRALDAVTGPNGEAVCREAAEHPECVAYDPIFFRASDEAKAYASVQLLTADEIEQTIVSATIGGEAFETDAGYADFVVGLEYRDESSQSKPDPLSQATDSDGIGSGLVGSRTGPTRDQNTYLRPINGSYHVAEVFGEMLIPLINGQTLVEKLELELAGRYADHSITGGDFTYKVALNWSIFEDLRLRSTYSHAVRAPNIEELFTPEQATAANMVDPCSSSNIGSGPQDGNRIDNCAAIGIAEGFVSTADFGTRTELRGGNTDLDPESADTYTLGLVITPLDELSIAIDYWDVEIEDAITTYNPSFILNNCVDGQSVNDKFCDLVNRNEMGQITAVHTESINVAAFVASGVDLDVNYSLDLGDTGGLNVHIKGTYLDERKFFNNIEDPNDKSSFAGQAGSPHLRALINTSYHYEDLNVSWSMNYIGRSTFNKEATEETYEDWFNNEVGSYVYHNINVDYQITNDLSAYLGVNNLTDKRPPALPNLNAGSLLYDGIGRKYYAGIRYTF